MQLIRAGERLKARRVTGSSIFNVVQGQGPSIIDVKAFDRSENDILALPSWALHEPQNTASTDAILFSINDRPVLDNLGFRRESALEGSGHQAIAA